MIFITVGTDLPFDRMIRALDDWAGASGRRDIFAQIGEGGWEPKNIEFAVIGAVILCGVAADEVVKRIAAKRKAAKEFEAAKSG